MKKILSATLLICILAMQSSFSQNIGGNINGTYVYKNNHLGSKWALQVHNNKFHIIEFGKINKSLYTFDGDTITHGKIIREGRNLIKLKSHDYMLKARKTLQIKAIYDSSFKDSICLKFSIQNNGLMSNNRPWPASFYVRNTDSGITPIPLGSTTLYMKIGKFRPNTIPDSFIIYNENMKEFSSAFDYNNLNIPYFEVSLWMLSEGKKDFNVIQIDIPDFDYNIFSQIFIDNEYCKASENSVTWRDKVFRKVSNKILDKGNLEKTVR